MNFGEKHGSLPLKRKKELSYYFIEGQENFLSLSTEVAGFPRYRKDLLRVGEWIHPATGQKLNFTLSRLTRMAKASNEWLGLGNKIWFSSGNISHNADSRNVLGFWDSFEVKDGVLFGVVEIRDKETIDKDKVGRTIVDVSPGIGLDVTASTGHHFEEVLMHIAATPQPVIPGQGNFIRLAREENIMEKKERLAKLFERAGVKMPDVLLDVVGRGIALQDDTEEKVDKAVIEGQPEEQAVANVLTEEEQFLQGAITPDELKEMLGLPPEAEEGDIIEAVRQMLTGAPGQEGEATVPTQPITPPTGVPLSARVDALENELKLSREETARVKMQAVHELCAKAGSPIDKDTEEIILTAFKEGRKDEAEAMLKLAKESATKVINARAGATAIPLGESQQKQHEENLMLERQSMVESLQAAGYTVEHDEKFNITKKTAPWAATG